jgi:hypothetical protein
LQRKYGLAIAGRLYGDRPELLDFAEASKDQDVSGLAKSMKRPHAIHEKRNRRRTSES